MESLREIILKRFSKEDLLEMIESDPKLIIDAAEFAVSDEFPEGWRSAWILNHCTKKNDERLLPYIDRIVNCIKDKGDGHQRELLKLLESYQLDEEQESILFDTCLTIWEEIFKSHSVRISAFKSICNIAKKYPELISEIEPLTQDHYIDSLSSGIKRSFERMKKEIVVNNE